MPRGSASPAEVLLPVAERHPVFKVAAADLDHVHPSVAMASTALALTVIVVCGVGGRSGLSDPPPTYWPHGAAGGLIRPAYQVPLLPSPLLSYPVLKNDVRC